MRAELRRWKDAGFNFSLEWLLRDATAVATGRAPFAALDGVHADTFRKALRSSVDYIDRFLNAVAGRLGLDHDRVLMGRYAIPVASRFLHLNGGNFRDAAERDMVLFWYVHAALRGRYAGSTETMLAHDYEVLERDGVEGLLTILERWRGGALDVRPHDFEGATRGSRFYPLLYMLTRVNGSRDLGTGLELRAELLGRLASLSCTTSFQKPCSTGMDTIEPRSTRSRSGRPRSTSPRPRRSIPVSWPPSGFPPTPRCGRPIDTPTSWRLGGSCSPKRPGPSSLSFPAV